jgi:hypothetical protein
VQSKLAKIEGMMISIDEYMQNQEGDDEMAMGEEKTSKRDNRAEKAGKQVTKDIEYDEKKKDGIHGKKRGAEDSKADRAGKKVTKDIEYDEKKSKKKEASEEIEGVKTLDKPSSNYRQSLKNKKGRMEAIAEIEHQIIDLKKELKSVRNDFDRKQIERKISSLSGTKKDIENLDKKSSGVKILPTQRDFESINKVARELEKMDLEKDKSHKKVGFDIPTSSAKKAETTSKVNKTIGKKEK